MSFLGIISLAAIIVASNALAACGDEATPDTPAASDVSVAAEADNAGLQPCEGAKVTVNYDADLVKNGLGCQPTPTQQIDVLISASEPNPADICTKMDGWLMPAVAGDPNGGWRCEYADPEMLR